jgi:hypothetical protein
LVSAALQIIQAAVSGEPAAATPHLHVVGTEAETESESRLA